MTRLLSHSEIDTALTCWARHAFAYTGRLTGGQTLKPRTTAPILSEGRAWGAAVAAWHAHGGELTALFDGHDALRKSISADAEQMAEAGVPPSAELLTEMENRLGAMLDHYAATCEPLAPLTMLEGTLDTPLLSRSGTGRASTRYRFTGFIDGYTVIDGRQWIVEFKLRGQLTPPELLERQRQIRWYAWALARMQGYGVNHGTLPAGVIVDERLNEVPQQPRTVQAKRKGEGVDGRVPSHAKDQVTTPELYADLCHEYGELPKLEVVEHMRQREWQRRFPILFRPGELEEAGRELTSAAKLIRDLDSGELDPIRHAKRQTCNGCRFKAICTNPGDDLLVDSLFTRTEPKRLRPDREEAPVGA